MNALRIGLLAWIAGEIDTFGYLAVESVFVTHMTGNTGVLAIAVVQRRWDEAFRRAMAILFFVCGAVCGGVLVARASHHREVARALLVEASLLVLAAFLTVSRLGALASDVKSGVFLMVLAIALGIQNAALTHPDVRGTHTTHITGPLTDLTVDVVRLLQGRAAAVDRHRTARLAARVGGFGVGALSGALLFVTIPAAAPVLAACALTFVAVGELRYPQPSARS